MKLINIILASLVRAALCTVGGGLVARGWMPDADLQTLLDNTSVIAGAAVAVLAALWGVLAKTPFWRALLARIGFQTGVPLLLLVAGMWALLASGCVNISAKVNPDGSWQASGWSFWKEVQLPTLEVRSGSNTVIRAEGWKTTNDANKAALDKIAEIANNKL